MKHKNTFKNKRLGKFELTRRLMIKLEGYMEQVNITKKHLVGLPLSTSLSVVSDLYEQFYGAPLTGTLFFLVRDDLVRLNLRHNC